MKTLLHLIFLTGFGFCISACTPDAEEAAEFSLPSTEADLTAVEHSLSIFDLRIRSLDEVTYIKEVKMINFADDGQLPGSIDFNGSQYMDDGQGNDLQAQDGIYASVSTFVHDKARPYRPDAVTYSVLKSPIVHPDFSFRQELRGSMADYDLRPQTAKILEVSCPVKFGCKGCLAERWGACYSCCICVDTSNCTITVGF